MEQLNQMLAQQTLWGLTYGQTAVVLLIAAGLVVVWMIFGTVFRLAGAIMRVGCALILVLSCGCMGVFLVTNLLRG